MEGRGIDTIILARDECAREWREGGKKKQETDWALQDQKASNDREDLHKMRSM